jgi:hypothetical protein
VVGVLVIGRRDEGGLVGVALLGRGMIGQLTQRI